MSPFPTDAEARGLLYAKRHALQLTQRLGAGKDGTVFATDKATALKIHAHQASFDRELACYQRLRERQVIDVHGHRVPQLVGWDDDLLVIEMTIVTRPYLLDFADAYLDETPDFSEEVLDYWHNEKFEEFGEVHWAHVQLVMAVLRGQCGIHLLDANRGNITFGEGEN